MRQRSIEVGLAVLAVVAFSQWTGLRPAVAAPTTTCATQTGPDCGGAPGDALCGDPATNDCFDTGDGCQCRPRVCCKCENVGDSTGCDTLGCTQTGLGLLVCVGLCIAQEVQGNSCNLKVLYQQQCSDGSCATSGCCQVIPPGAQAPQAGNVNACVETDQTTCTQLNSTFVAGGSCSGGLDGTCVSPTPTATPTETPTLTSTPTQTPTATPTNTPKLPDGAGCATPSDCTSDFCVDGVCCDTACDQPGQICNDAAQPGTCTSTAAPAPALSTLGLFGALAALALVAAVALMLRARPR
jgi:hypothetical protein